MNKLFNLLCCSLLLIAGLAACSADGDDPPEQPDSHQDEVPVDSIINPIDDSGSSAEYEVISTVPVSEKVKAFFDEALPISDSESALLILNDDEIPELLTTCHIINSIDELGINYLGNKPFPQMDFDNNTLIYGRVLIDEEEVLDSVSIRIYNNYKDNGKTKILVFHTTDYSLTAAYEHICGKMIRYWGIFPKQNNERMKWITLSTKIYR